jgi:hypothetical protein
MEPVPLAKGFYFYAYSEPVPKSNLMKREGLRWIIKKLQVKYWMP